MDAEEQLPRDDNKHENDDDDDESNGSESDNESKKNEILHNINPNANPDVNNNNSNPNSNPTANINANVNVGDAPRHSFHSQRTRSQQQLLAISELLSRGSISSSNNLHNNNGNDAELMKYEMTQLNDDKSLYSDLFDKIDSKQNGDLDLNEWIHGLLRLGVTLSQNEMQTIFQCMDGEDSQFVSREDFIAFCIRPFQSVALKNLQQQLIQQIRGHIRQPSNLIRPNDDIREWDPIAMHSMQQEMQQHMVSLTTNMVDSVQVEAKFYEEIEKHADDPSFANADKAPEWTPQEVAFWLDSIDFGQYSRRFHDDAIDGSILLNDIDRAILQGEMGIKPLHVGKMLREIEKLRQKHSNILHSPYKDWNQLSKENESLSQQLNQAYNRVRELEAENMQLKLRGQNNNDNQNNIMPPNDDLASARQESTDVTNPSHDETQIEDEKDQKIIALTKEIESLQRSKYELVIATDKEIQTLRKIIRILSSEYDALQTPMYKRYNNPLDSLMTYMGYEKQK